MFCGSLREKTNPGCFVLGTKDRTAHSHKQVYKFEQNTGIDQPLISSTLHETCYWIISTPNWMGNKQAAFTEDQLEDYQVPTDSDHEPQKRSSSVYCLF